MTRCSWEAAVAELVAIHEYVSLNELVDLLDQQGVIDQEYKVQKWRAAARREVGEILRSAKRPDGLPMYGQRASTNGDHKHRWAQLELLSAEDWQYEIDKRLDQRDALHEEALRLADAFHSRFGFRPEMRRLPELMYGDETEPHPGEDWR